MKKFLGILLFISGIANAAEVADLSCVVTNVDGNSFQHNFGGSGPLPGDKLAIKSDGSNFSTETIVFQTDKVLSNGKPRNSIIYLDAVPMNQVSGPGNLSLVAGADTDFRTRIILLVNNQLYIQQFDLENWIASSATLSCK